MDSQNVMNNPATEFLEWARRDTEPKSPFDSIAPYEGDDIELDHDDFDDVEDLEIW